MTKRKAVFPGRSNRRTFLKKGALAAGATASGAGLLLNGSAFAFDQEDDGPPITKGDIAILRFLNALEQVEADLWRQYSELGGVQDNEVSGTGGGNKSHLHGCPEDFGWGHASVHSR
jgi:hypothetical protein